MVRARWGLCAAGAVVLVAAAFFVLGSEPIRIGFVGTLTGTISDLGVQGRNGATLAVEEINEAGGVAGRELRLIARDDRGDPEEARRVDRELIDRGVAAIVGHMTSSMTLAALPVTEAAGTVLFSPTTSTPRLSGKEDLFFRLEPASDLAARALARYARETEGLESVAVLWDPDNKAYAEPYARAFADQLEREGGTVPATYSFATEETSNRKGWTALLGADAPRGVLLIASARDVAILAQPIRSAHPEWTLLSGGWAATSALLDSCGPACRGMVLAGTLTPGGASEVLRAFSRRYRTRFGREPSFAARQAYDTVRVLARALEATGGSADGLPEALTETEDFPGLVGDLSLNRYGDLSYPATILRVEGETFKPVARVTPEEL